MLNNNLLINQKIDWFELIKSFNFDLWFWVKKNNLMLNSINFLWHSFSLLKLFYLFFYVPATKCYPCPSFRNKTVATTFFRYAYFDILTWYLICGCMMISYRSSLHFVLVQWFLAKFMVCPFLYCKYDHLHDYL